MHYSIRFLMVSTVIVLLFLTSAQQFSKTSTSAIDNGGEWQSFTFDNSDSRYNNQSNVTSANVGNLPSIGHGGPTWFFSTGTGITSTPIVLDGRAYVADWSGNVWCVFVSNGSACWSSPTHLPVGVSSTLAAPGDGKVYVAGGPIGTVASPQDQVFALNQLTGTVVWNRMLPPFMSSIWASPIIYNRMVYIGEAGQDQKALHERGAIFALDSSTGSIVWNLTVGIGAAMGAPIIASVVTDPTLNSIYFATGNTYDKPSSTNNDSLYAYSILSVD